MSGEPIGVGDMVECVDPSGDARQWLEIGRVYRVDGFGLRPGTHCGRCGEKHAFVQAGRYRPELDGWCPTRFRPISRRSSFERVLEELRRPAPQPDRTPSPALAERG